MNIHEHQAKQLLKKYGAIVPNGVFAFTVKDLLENGAEIIISDPKVNSFQIARDLNLKENHKELNSEFGYWKFSKDIYEAVQDSDAIVLLTEWNEYKDLDWARISKKMRSPSWVFDTRSISNDIKIKKAGLNYWCLGNGAAN